jgi:hypothetical protein
MRFALSNAPNRVFSSSYLILEKDPISKTLCFLVNFDCREVGKVQKLNDCKFVIVTVIMV